MPVSVGQAEEAARARLQGASQYPARDAQALLAHLLGWNAVKLLTHPEQLLSPEQSSRYEGLVDRRLAHEPMQYITGSQEFFGLLLEVSPAVLIPRPETEHVVEAALQHLSRERDTRIVDVGTGSGAIAVALAHTLRRSQIAAVDLSAGALEVAQRNAARHGVAERVTFLQSDLLEAVEGENLDAVVSNPPYIADAEVLERQVSAYEPHSALYAGPTGLEVYERLIPQAFERLKPGGWLILEIGFGQQQEVNALLSGWRDISLVTDLQGIPRVVTAQKS